jgi:hypothetical protein
MSFHLTGDKVITGIGEAGAFLFIALSDLDNVIKIISAITILSLICYTKFIDIKNKKLETKSRELDIDNKKLDKRIKLKELAEDD